MIHAAPFEPQSPDRSPRLFGRPARVLLGAAGREGRNALTCELKREGYQVDHAFSAAELKARLFFESFELVVYDTSLSGGPVLDALLTGHSPRVIIIALTVSEALNAEAARLRAVIVDPFVAARDVCTCAVTLAAPWVSAEGNAGAAEG